MNSLHENQLSALKLLSKQFPTVQSVCTEIINLNAILDLPMATEHFVSDLHGEYEAVCHLLNNDSGVIRGKIDLLYSDTLTEEERARLATLIYYPGRKLEALKELHKEDLAGWYTEILVRLIEICRLVASKYTRSKVRKALPSDFSYIIDELLHADHEEMNKVEYYQRIISTIVEVGRADAFIEALATLIKRLAVDVLHVVGDIYDRGPGAEEIMDLLMNHHSVDIQWGNHDMLWMGAAAGNEACIATVINTSLAYANVDTIENGYGISLRELATFAVDTYGDCPAFRPKLVEAGKMSLGDPILIAKLRKAVAVIQFKLEGQLVSRHPEYDMDERMLLDKIDYENGTITLGEKEYPLRDRDFPTVDPENPYLLNDAEKSLMAGLKASFVKSDKLQTHMHFLLTAGSLYLCCNHNLLFHGCVPLAKDGGFARFEFGGRRLWGKSLFDYCEEEVRKGFYAPAGSIEKQNGEDFMWFLWCGKNSPVFGKSRMTTLERTLVEDKSTWEEPLDCYYQYHDDEAVVERILAEFGLGGAGGHIINGHIPVRFKDGESPIKAGGRLLVIDGGFCKAYQPTTGIAGYTLINNSHGMRLVSHGPFDSIDRAVRENSDILSTSTIFEVSERRRRVSDTDIGDELRSQIGTLRVLLDAYRSGLLPERVKK